MLPPIVTKSFEHITLSIISFTVIMVAGAFVAMLLAHSFGGKSQVKRQAVFRIISFGSLCAAAYYAMSKFNGSG
jgi:hypothetical protein